jgi:hypothetical protein
MKTLRSWVIPWVASAGLLTACAHEDSGRATAALPDARGRADVGVTNAQPPSPDEDVVERLSSARCSHEQACGLVRPGQRWAGMDACMDHMRGSIRDELTSADCTSGVDRRALDDCLTAIDAEGCGDGVAVMRRTRRCRAAVICLNDDRTSR